MRSLTTRYSLIQAAYWMGLAVILGFASPYLIDCGFTNGETGALMAAAGLVTAFSQPSLASLADRPGGPSPRLLAALLGIGICAGACGLMLTGGLLTAGLLYIAVIVLLQSAQPQVNSLGMVKDVDFGLARGIGSVAYAVIAWAVGRLADHSGSAVIPIGMVGCFLLFVVFTALYPVKRPEASNEAASSGAAPLEFIKKYPGFCIALVGCMLTYISHVVLSNFTFQIVQSKGGSGMEMGTVAAIAALAELPTMFLFTRMRRRAGCGVWLRVSGVFFFLRSLGTLLCASVAGLCAVQVFQTLGWALMAVNSVYYTSSVMSPEDAVKGQAYFTLSYTAASVIGSVAGGVLLDRAGASAMLLFGTLSAGAGAAVIFAAAGGRSR